MINIHTYEMEIIIMTRPKINKIKLTEDEVKRLKKILKKKDTNQILPDAAVFSSILTRIIHQP